MLTLETFTPIVDEINKLYGSTHYLPATVMWSDGVFFVETFGKIVWDSDNCSATSPSTIKDLVFYNMNRDVLNTIWKEQAEVIRDDVLYKVVSEDNIKESLEEFFEAELSLYEEGK